MRRDVAPPAWAREAASGSSSHVTHEGVAMDIVEGKGASFVIIRIADVERLNAEQFEEQTHGAYRAIQTALTTLRLSHPVRFWNYLPAIHQPLDATRDRYKVFNAGRYRAFQGWFENTQGDADRMPAASAVGHSGSELVIHCLALDRPGVHLENPRQIPAYRYSERYGRLPPAFARATVVPRWVDGRTLLIAAGTASIRGEESVCNDNLKGQLTETINNLRSLLGAAEGSSEFSLSQFEELRVYCARPADSETIRESIAAAFGTKLRLEMVEANLCRAELLVEIEGMARLVCGRYA